MIAWLCCFLPAAIPVDAPPDAVELELAAHVAPQDDPAKEFERRHKDAGDDVVALWELYLWCDAYGLAKQGRTCLREIIKHEPSHKQAREALGHVYYDGQWFTSEKALEKYKQEEAERLAKEQGLVRYKGEWVPAEDVPFLERGLVRDEDGSWVDAQDLERLRAGWRRQDLVWVSPEEIAKLDEGLWKCGEEWKSLEEANRYHATIERWWIVPTNRYLVHSTCERAVIEQALETMDRAHRELVRVFGIAPSDRVPVVLLMDARQYSSFNAGEGGANDGAELRGLSSVHHACFADAWRAPDLANSFGAGVAMWDASSEEKSAFGPFAARHAAGLAFAEGIDPSPKLLAKLAKAKTTQVGASDVEAFWAEKRIPEWLRYGAAAYAERYYIDNLVKQGGNPYWMREWALSNLVARGGLRPLREVFDTRLSVDDVPGSEKLLSERGLVVAFVLDGECAPVVAAHQAFKQSMQDDKNIQKSLDELVAQILAHESELRTFAGI